MADSPLTDHLFDSTGQITTTGSSNAYVIATAEPITGYIQGMPVIRFKASFGNTGSATVNINSIGAATLKKGGGATNLASGDIVSGGVYTISFDGTNFQVLELNGFAGVSAGSVGTTQLADDAVTNAKLADMVQLTIKARKTASTGNPEDCTLSEVLDFVTSAAQGDILFRGASAWARLGAGTSGQFLKTQGAGANPVWADGNPAYVTSGTVTTAATLDLTIPASCDMMEIELWNWRPATDSTTLFMRFSQSSAFLSGASDYKWGGTFAAVATSDAADSEIEIAQLWGNLTAEVGHCIVRIFKPLASATIKACLFEVAYHNILGNYISDTGGGELLANTNAIDGVRFLFSSGNISTGFYAVRSYRYS